MRYISICFMLILVQYVYINVKVSHTVVSPALVIWFVSGLEAFVPAIDMVTGLI